MRIVLAGLAVAAVALFFRSPSRLAAGSLPRVAADGQATGESSPPDRCTGSKGCLIVYVAPWCGPCQQSLPGDRALADFVRERGFETTFVVGMDTLPRCSEMVRRLGREALVDESGAWAKRMKVSGVPHFLVTDADGRILKRQAGALQASPEVVARHLGI